MDWERKTDKKPMVISRCCSVGSELALFRLAVCRLDKVRTESWKKSRPADWRRTFIALLLIDEIQLWSNFVPKVMVLHVFCSFNIKDSKVWSSIYRYFSDLLFNACSFQWEIILTAASTVLWVVCARICNICQILRYQILKVQMH